MNQLGICRDDVGTKPWWGPVYILFPQNSFFVTSDRKVKALDPNGPEINKLNSGK
jgi:hypothetical protein